MTDKITIKVDYTDVDKTIKKLERLVELLLEAQQIMIALSNEKN